MTTERLIAALQNPALYDHPTTEFQIIETHISWVILTGNFAYKIKKSVNLGFLDFSSLDQRCWYCHQEVRANQALSPEIYLAVIPITGSVDNPQFCGRGEIIEYAILMREFNQENLFTSLLKRHALTSDLIDDIAILLAKFHAKANTAVPSPTLGSPEQILQPVKQNFDQIRELLANNVGANIDQINRLESWSYQQWEILKPVFAQRKEQGYIRECHGDIHLGNITLINHRPVIFDCIEFNDELRWIDVISDVAFLAIDLIDNQYEQYAHQLLSYYLEHTSDYFGLKVLVFYQVYRAIVRAKVNLFKYTQMTKPEEKNDWYQRFCHYMNLAEELLVPQKQQLFITYGLAGSGKSTVSQTLVRERGVIRLRSDIIRKKLHDMEHLDRSASGLNQNIYAPAVTEKVYQLMAERTQMIVDAGFSVVVDASFLLRQQREIFFKIAAEKNLPIIILVCAAPYKTLQTRIELRQAVNRDPSEADLSVLEMQRQSQELLTKEELARTIVVDAQDEDRYNLLNQKVDAFLEQ